MTIDDHILPSYSIIVGEPFVYFRMYKIVDIINFNLTDEMLYCVCGIGVHVNRYVTVFKQS